MRRPLSLLLPTLVVLLCLTSLPVCAEEAVGKRPYEMDWAGRTQPQHVPAVDFESLEGWSADAKDAVASFERTRQQQLWDTYVGKLTYRRDGKQPAVEIRPPKPLAVEGPFDCVSLWVYGNNWAWVPDPSTPQVNLDVLLRAKDGGLVAVPLGNVRWREWWFLRRKLSPEQVAQLSDGATFEGIRVTNGRNTEDRVLFFDNLAFYKEALPPLTFEPRPRRNLTLPEGQTTGTNTGPGVLPFPNREETILPTNLAKESKGTLEVEEGRYAFRYAGDDGELVYVYAPKSGGLDDVTAQWKDRGEPLRPLSGGGVWFVGPNGQPIRPEKLELTECTADGDTITSAWRAYWQGNAADVKYTLRLLGKSLVVDVQCLGGHVARFDVGGVVGAQNPRVVRVPYLAGDWQNRPAVVVTGQEESPLFLQAILDHHRTNSSHFWFKNDVADGGAYSNGGSIYTPKTDGRRNPCFERLFLTISPKFEEVLPNIPNDPSPWKHVAGERLWRAHGATDREQDYAYWKNIADYGMTKVVITDHETGWRDGGESFTFRTKTAPGRGGDASQKEYAERLHALGFRYGIYNNYTDFAPVNEFWHDDMVTRQPDGNLNPAWARCYNPKPARAVEYEARLAPIIQEKFHLSTAYCDVHTAVHPWSYVDYDARVPGAATFVATFFAYGEIMLHQKKTWNGPVYSEGNNHWYYCGLTDGNYAQDQVARLADNPWLVDFDLRKMHPLCCNFGMGNLDMFFGSNTKLDGGPGGWDANLDRFLAATLAFGHTGFLVGHGGIESTVRSYFGLQQLHARYAIDTIDTIHYADENGSLLDTDAAVATGAFERSQLALRYCDGLEVYVNGNKTQPWTVDGRTLPPNGWLVRDPVKRELVAESLLYDGHRVDYVESPAYYYADGRGRFTRFARLACDGPLIAHRRDGGALEVIPVGRCKEFAASFDGREATATALDREGKELGPAEARLSRGCVYITPKEGAFKYRLTPGEAPKTAIDSPRTFVVPGETVPVVSGEAEYTVTIPADAEPGTRLWRELDGAWIDFSVRPLAETRLRLREDAIVVSLTPHLPEPTDAVVTLRDAKQPVRLEPQMPVEIVFPLAVPEQETVQTLPLTIESGAFSLKRAWYLKTEYAVTQPLELPKEYAFGERLRGETKDRMNSGDIRPRPMACGEVEKEGVFMHPPYREGPGCAFVIYGPLEIPSAPPVEFACSIGKGDGSDPGDGILFQVSVVDENGTEETIAETIHGTHSWAPFKADLSRFAGKTVHLKLIADVGPADDSSGDWANWGDLRFNSKEPLLVTTLHEVPVRLAFEPGDGTDPSVIESDLREAKEAILHFEGVGIEGGGEYVCDCTLGGIPIGFLPNCGGNEVAGTFGRGSIPLETVAIAAIKKTCVLEINNPGGDCYKVRNIYIDCILANGRHIRSKTTTAVFSQPGTWKYAEGIRVPPGEPIRVELRF